VSLQNKVGIGIITRNRPVYFKNLITTIPRVDRVVVVNDGDAYDDSLYTHGVDEVVQHPKNMGISKSKNDALKSLMGSGCRHIFILEDDIAIRDKKIFKKYVRASEVSGILHFNYAFHGDWNRDEDGRPLYKLKKNYPDGTTVTFHYNLTAALSYYRDRVIETVGYLDENYKNILEHVDHTYRIIKHGFHPPFWWFADILDSCDGIKEQDPMLVQSTHRHRWLPRKTRARIFGFYFMLKNGCRPSRVPVADKTELMRQLSEIGEKFSDVPQMCQ